jgi:hypothetical protein
LEAAGTTVSFFCEKEGRRPVPSAAKNRDFRPKEAGDLGIKAGACTYDGYRMGGSSVWRSKYGIALVLALGLLLMAVPRLPVALEADADSVFALSWLALALLVIAANWRMVLRVDEERERRSEWERRLRWLEAQRKQRRFETGTGQRRRLFS